MTDYSKFKVADAFKHLDPTQWASDDITSGFPQIRFRGKTWTLRYNGKSYMFRRDDDGTPLSYLDIIILGVSQGKSRVYFGPGEWSEDSTSGPICASNKGDVPDPGVPVPQSKTCATCDHSQWNTKPDGSRKPECQEYKRLAVLLMPNMTKKMLGGTALREPVHLKIPPGSFKTWKPFTDDLISQGIPLASVVTRVSFSPPPKQFEMAFDIIASLSNAESKFVLPMMKDGQTQMILGTDARRPALAPPPPPPVTSGLLEEFENPAPHSVPDADDESEFDESPAPPPPAPAKRGRKPKQVVTIENTPAPPPPAPEPPSDDESVGDVPWEESDTDLDQTVARLMEKTSKMLK